MDLFGVLRLAMILEVNLAAEGERIAATPKENMIPELREAIRKNRDELLDHLRRVEEHELYGLLCEVALRGANLKSRNGRLVVKPKEALTPELVEGLKKHGRAVVTALEDRELSKTGVIQCERQVVNVAREVLA